MYEGYLDVDLIAVKLGRSGDAIRQKLRDVGLPTKKGRPSASFQGGKKFTVNKPPSAHRPIEQLISDHRENYERKKAHYEPKRQGIEINLEEDAPYGILWFGDPHVDDNGTDLDYFSYCLGLVKDTPGVYAANIGDLSNNWIGRLGSLYAHQNTTDDEARVMVEWLIGEVPWLFVILGNHDKWGIMAEMVCRAKEVMAVSHGGMFKINAGDSTLVVDARHTHPGNSQYNPAFAQTKKQYKGSPAHIIIGGHIHTGAYTMVRNGTSGTLGHCIRLGAFKKYDEYADMLGFADDSVGPACLTVVDPSKPEDSPGFVNVFWDLDHGIKFLGSLRAG